MHDVCKHHVNTTIQSLGIHKDNSIGNVKKLIILGFVLHA